MRPPDFIIGGASKSGTTSMYRWLGAHPEIGFAPGKEVRYFDGHNAHRGWDWYLAQFPDDRIIGEASPRYLTAADPAEIAERLPEVRLIFLLREPVARAYSDHWMHRALELDTRSFEEALEDPVAWERCVGTGEYARHLRPFLDRFRVLLVLTKEMQTEPVETFARVCRFLDVEPISNDVVGTTVNAGVGYRSLRVRRMAKRLPRLPARVVGRLNSTALTYPPMDPRTAARLHHHYEPHNEALAGLLGRTPF